MSASVLYASDKTSSADHKPIQATRSSCAADVARLTVVQPGKANAMPLQMDEYEGTSGSDLIGKHSR
jgi:hypothetical protein